MKIGEQTDEIPLRSPVAFSKRRVPRSCHQERRRWVMPLDAERSSNMGRSVERIRAVFSLLPAPWMAVDMRRHLSNFVVPERGNWRVQSVPWQVLSDPRS
ncbi:MAG: hypothetical protein ACI9AO_001028, partial [Ilumatobacter sp.]